MENNSQANKRIAKNTLIIYGQLVLRLLLGLYTSRLALEALGVSDYGLYSVVAGVVVLFMFISLSLSNTSIRFLNVERGKPDGNLNKVFNICHTLHLFIAIFLFLILELCGLFYIHHFLNVDPGKLPDAIFVFHIATIACCIGIVNIPFSSLFNAEEKFIFTASVSIGVKTAQLLLLICLLHYDGNRIKAFALIESLTEIISFAVLHYFSIRNWPEVIRWKFVKEWNRYKEVISFSFYSLMETFASMGRGQGSALIINYFFGTVVNGAFAVAMAIDRIIVPFGNNIQSAATPQITQSYSSGNMDRVYYLTSRVCRYCLLLMMIAFFPLWAEFDFILHLWLGQVPEGALLFSQLILLIVFVYISDGGINQVINASGNISRFKLTYSLIMISCLPIGFAVLKAGAPAYMLLVVFLFGIILWRIIQLIMMHAILRFPVVSYCRDAFLPAVLSGVPVIICMAFTTQIKTDTTIWHITHLASIAFITICSIYFIGLKENERAKVRKQIASHLKKDKAGCLR